ncbi:MAG: hypothetical protein LBF86_00535 [Helicobacteraceae bacterium]|nr:hypothetical protein [Helicobacteraceae bacterium]
MLVLSAKYSSFCRDFLGLPYEIRRQFAVWRLDSYRAAKDARSVKRLCPKGAVSVKGMVANQPLDALADIQLKRFLALV